MPRPSFQFYPADWRNNAKLRRCSEAARGAWMDVLCVLNDSDEYGVCRWPLADLARSAGVPLKLLKELAAKDVLKGGDKQCEAYVYTPRSGRKNGEPVTLVAESDGPCWYSSRMVRDEHVRQTRGSGTRFGAESDEDGQHADGSPNATPKAAPKRAPKPPFGERSGDGSSSSSSSSIKTLTTLSGKPDVLAVLAHLNAKTGRKYEPVDANTRLIAGRLKDGATVEQCKAVIDAKVAKWGADPKMADYLRPKTLFNATNYAQYVGELGAAAAGADGDGQGGQSDPRFRGMK